MKHFEVYKSQLEKLAQKHGLEYIRIFGSATRSLDEANDVDLLVGADISTLEKYSDISGDFEALFNKKIDLVYLKPGLNPHLICEIGATSEPLFEAEGGRSKYADEMVRFHAIASDEILSMKYEDLDQAIEIRQKRLKDV